MSYTLRNKNYPVRPVRYSDNDWVTEFPRPENRYTIRYWQWIKKLAKNKEPLGYKPEEKVESWLCGECSGYFHATRTIYEERYCCEKCWDKAE